MKIRYNVYAHYSDSGDADLVHAGADSYEEAEYFIKNTNFDADYFSILKIFIKSEN